MKKSITIVLIAIIFFLEKSIAQFTTQWTANYQNTTANNFSNESRKVVTDAAGNSFVLADVTSNKDPNGNITASTWHYTVLSKYSSTGVLLTTKLINIGNHSISGFDNNGAFGMEIDANDFIYIGYISYDPVKNFDVNITRYKNNLVRLWNRRYNSSDADYGVDMALGSGGAVYAIVKSVSGANSTYSIIQANANAVNDTAVYSFTANTDVLNAITVQGGVIYATGYRMISGYKNVLTVKLNNLGTLKWTKTFAGGIAGDDYGQDIKVGADGNVYITGSSWRGSPDNFDVLIMKLSTSGAPVWNRYRDYNHQNDVGLIIQADDSDYVYAGSTSGNDIVFNQVETLLGTTGGKGVYSPVPLAPYVLLSGIELNDFKVSINHGFYLCGSVFATDALGRLYSAEFLAKFIFAGPNIRDAFKLDSEMPVSGDFANTRAGVSISLDYFKDDVYLLSDLVSDNGNHNQEKVILRDLNMISPIREGNAAYNAIVPAGEISIAPNPSADMISLSSSEKITKIELFDLTGKTVKSITAASEKVTMDISGLMNGIYIGRIYSESGTVTARKIIKN